MKKDKKIDEGQGKEEKTGGRTGRTESTGSTGKEMRGSKRDII